MEEKKYTPIIEQYLSVKRAHEGYLVFFRLGDFYEMFFDDAVIASKELDLVLTGRDAGAEQRIPMCGVPYHAVEGYLAKLVNKGYKIVICEQMEDAAEALGGLIRRDVARIVTPGTLIESGLLTEGANNYIAGISMSDADCGLALADVSTGVFMLTGVCGYDRVSDLINELAAYNPAEVILSCKITDPEIGPVLANYMREKLGALISDNEQKRFVYDECLERVISRFGRAASDQIPADRPEMVRAAGGLLDYLYETQRTDLSCLRALTVYEGGQYMSIDVNTRRNLELCQTSRSREKKGSLLWVLDRTKTAGGARLLRRWIEQPLMSVPAIMRRQDAVKVLHGDMITRSKLMKLLGGIGDIERIMTRIVYKTANCRDINALGRSISVFPALRELADSRKNDMLASVSAALEGLDDLPDLISRAVEDEPPLTVREGGIIKAEFHPEVERLRSAMNDGRSLVGRIETAEREATGIKTLKVSYNRVFGYYIEITKSNLSNIPDRYIRKQTLVNCERFITQELKDMEGEILSASDRLKSLEYELYIQLMEHIASRVAAVQQAAGAVSQLDVICSLAETASKYNYSAPDVDISDQLIIKDGRHPVLERLISDSLYVPNDALLDCNQNRLCIVTGPNMAGKSTFMRQIALITLMAQMGSFVPAKSAKIGLADKIFTRIGASDDLSAGQSTFMLEMNEVAYILKNATSRSLIIYDEIGRGTSTYDGMSIARAIIEYTAGKNLSARTVFATHYHELTELEEQLPGVKNYNITAKKRGDELIFLRKIVRGGADDSYGIEVATLAGLPPEVIRRSKEILRSLEEGRDVRPAVKQKVHDRSDNISFDDMKNEEIVAKLKSADLNVLTPIEAMNLLFELKKKADS